MSAPVSASRTGPAPSYDRLSAIDKGGRVHTTLQLTGSTTLLPRMQRAAEAYMDTHPDRIVINGGCGTTRGYKALLDGTTDIAMASGAPPDQFATVMASRGQRFRVQIVSHDAILAIVHAANPLRTVSRLALRNIFTGRVANWRQLGGPDAPIEVLVGPPAGGVSVSWRNGVYGAEDTTTPQARVMGMDERIARVTLQPHAITYAAQPGYAPRAKVLRIAGLAPGDQAYAPRAPMMLVTLGAATPAAARFIAFAATVAGTEHE
jgi:phosphate transport system substrate-binding protein